MGVRRWMRCAAALNKTGCTNVAVWSPKQHLTVSHTHSMQHVHGVNDHKRIPSCASSFLARLAFRGSGVKGSGSGGGVPRA